jgi:hypothetical protein
MPIRKDDGAVIRIKKGAIDVRRAHLQRVIPQLPEIHRQAHNTATAVLHQHLTGVAESAGLDPAPLGVFSRKGHSYIGIAYGPAGDELANAEFGHVDSAPNAVLRTAARAAHPAVNDIYRQHMRVGLGL